MSETALLQDLALAPDKAWAQGSGVLTPPCNIAVPPGGQAEIRFEAADKHMWFQSSWPGYKPDVIRFGLQLPNNYSFYGGAFEQPIEVTTTASSVLASGSFVLNTFWDEPDQEGKVATVTTTGGILAAPSSFTIQGGQGVYQFILDIPLDWVGKNGDLLLFNFKYQPSKQVALGNWMMPVFWTGFVGCVEAG